MRYRSQPLLGIATDAPELPSNPDRIGDALFHPSCPERQFPALFLVMAGAAQWYGEVIRRAYTSATLMLWMRFIEAEVRWVTGTAPTAAQAYERF